MRQARVVLGLVLLGGSIVVPSNLSVNLGSIQNENSGPTARSCQFRNRKATEGSWPTGHRCQSQNRRVMERW